jgi:zinc protease
MKHTRTSLCALSLLAAFSAGAAVPTFPAELPPFAKDKPLPVPAITKKTLPNGMQIWVLPKNGIPRVDFVLAIQGAGFGADAQDAPGRARLLAGLLSEGTAKRSSKQIAEAAQAMGGSVGAGASNDGITVFGNALASHAGNMVSLLAEVARTPTFPEREVMLAKTNALQGLKAQSAQPAYRATTALNHAVYAGHAYGRTQDTEASLNAASPEQFRTLHAQRFRPDRALLVITGKVTAADAMKMAEAAFGDWKASGEALPALAPPPASVPVQRLLVERPGSVQATLRLGRPGIAAATSEQVALRVASTVLGTGFSSRVNINLREEKGYTYGARAGSVSFRAGGLISGGADVRNEVTGASIAEYVKEYRRIGAEPVPADELALHKRYMAGSYLVGAQLQAAQASQLAGNWLVGLPAEFLANYVPALQKVTAEQVQAVGKKYFDPDQQSWVVVGDPTKIGEQLKAFGEFTVFKP